MTLNEILERDGRMPRVRVAIYPVDRQAGREFTVLPVGDDQTITAGFLGYDFDQNIMVPVDSWSFSLVAPGEKLPIDIVRDGDVMQILAGGIVIATGIVDAVEEHGDVEGGERVTIRGRDLLSQLEDQSAINDQDAPLWMDDVTVETVVRELIANTRLQSDQIVLDQVPTGKYLFQSEPMESKLTALLRFLEPLNCLVWADPEGRITIGRPNFYQEARGTFFALKTERRSNIMSYRVVRNATQISNVILPIFAGQELAQDKVAKQQRLYNTAARPSELYSAGHRVPKTVVVSHPSGLDPNYINTITVNNAQTGRVSTQLRADTAAGSSLFIQQWAKRMIARENMGEILVDVVVPGHFGDDGRPYLANQVWNIQLERAAVNRRMYCYAVKYQLEDQGSPMTTLSFCNLNTIVAESIAP